LFGGEVEVSLAGETRRVKAGGFQGAAERPARVLILDVPAHAESFFREVEREVREMPRDLAKVPEIGERHQIRFARPAGQSSAA